MATQEDIIIKVTVDNDAARKNIEQQTQNIVSLENEIKRLQQVQKQANTNTKEGAREYKQAAELIALNRDELNKSNASRRQSIKELNTENSSINALRNSVAKLTKQRNEVNTSTKQGRAEFKRLTNEIKTQNDQLKGLEQSAGDFRRNVGNYGSALDTATGGLTNFGGSLNALFDIIKANPILLLIGALVGLVKVFAETQTGAEFFRKTGAALNVVFGVFSDIVEEVGAALISAFEDPQESLTNLQDTIKNGIIYYFSEFIPNAISKVIDGFGLLGSSIKAVFEGDFDKALSLAEEGVISLGDGITDLNPVTAALKTSFEVGADAIKSYAKEYDGVIGKAFKLEEALIANEKALANQEVSFAKSIKSQKELNLIIEDTTKTTEERIAAAQKFNEVEEQQIQQQIKLQQQRVNILKAQNDLTNSTEEDIQRVRDAEIELANLQAASFERRVTNQNKLNAIITQGEAENKKRTEAELNSIKSKEEAEFELAQLKKQLAAEEITDAQQRAAALSEIEQAELENTLENLRIEKEARILAAKETGESIEAINAEYKANSEAATLESNQKIAGYQEDAKNETQEIAQKEQEIQASKNAAYVDGVDGALSVASSLTKDNAEAQKAIALTQAILNGYQAVSNALASAPPPANYALAAVSGAAAAVQVANIANTKFAKGGLTDGGVFSGNSHANGGVKFAVGGRVMEAEGGEAIINKKNTALFRPVLSAINSYGGNGKKFANGGITTFQDGGVASSGAIGSVDSLVGSQQAIDNALSNMPNPVVSVVDINTTQNRVDVKESRASL